PKAMVYLDLNHNGILDGSGVTVTPTSLALAPAPSSSAVSKDQLASLNVTGLPAPAGAVTVFLDVTNTTGGTVEVDLVSPVYGSTVQTGAALIFLNPGDHFRGTFDERAAAPVS